MTILLASSIYYIYSQTYGSVWSLRKEYQELLQLSESGKDYTYELEVLNLRLKEVDALIGNDKISGGDIQHYLLSEFQQLSETLKIKTTNVPAPHLFQLNDFNVLTGIFEISGSYTDLLKVIDYLERDFPYASLSSIHFRIEQDYSNKNRNLLLTLYLQNISTHEN